MRCEVYSNGVIDPYFFENVDGHTGTVHAERYKVMLETFLCYGYILVNKICCGSNKMEQLLT
jgi:hypothetical protein